jgi:twinkle protein
MEFFKKRGISEYTLRKMYVKNGQLWCGDDNPSVNFIAFQYIKNNMSFNTKYRDSKKIIRQDKNGEKFFYNWDRIKDADDIFITEGEMDALSLFECGFESSTSVPDGAPAPSNNDLSNKFSFLTDEFFKLCDKAKRIFLITDKDINGLFLESELRRRIDVDYSKCLQVSYPDDCKDINDVLVKYGEDEVNNIIDSAKPFPVDGVHTFGEFRDEIINYYNNGIEKGTSTGWMKMDEYLTLQSGKLNILTGIPNSGKSEWLDALIINTIGSNGWKWAIFSPENMPPHLHFQKYAEKMIGKSMMFGDRISINELDAAIRVADDHIDLIIPDEDNRTLECILKAIRESVRRKGIKGFVIDPWNEIDHKFNGRTETDYISDTLGIIRRFARKNKLSAWIVAHPQKLQRDKNGQYPVPSLYDISGGAHWNNKADNGVVVWRKFVEDQKKSYTEIFIKKVRFKTCGKIGSVRMQWNYINGQYEEMMFDENTTNEQLNDYDNDSMGFS